MFDLYLNRAMELHAAYERDFADIDQNAVYTAKEKQAQLEQLETKRRHNVEQLQAEARSAIQEQRSIVVQKLKPAHAQEIERQRELLGDILLADILRRSLETMSPGEIVQAYQLAATPWERAVISGYGLPILRKRFALHADPVTFQAMEILRQSLSEESREAQQALQALNAVERRLDELDQQQYRADIETRPGKPASLPPGVAQ